MAGGGNRRQQHEPKNIKEMIDDELVQEYSLVLEQLSERPFTRELHDRHVAIVTQLGLTGAELDSARDMLAQYFALDERTWLAWIDDKKARVAEAPEDDLDGHVQLMELYNRAVQDYLSIPILVSCSEYYISHYYKSLGLSPPTPDTVEDDEDDDANPDPSQKLDARRTGEPDLVLGAAFELEDVRRVRDGILKTAFGHLAQSKKVWSLWRDLELDLFRLGLNQGVGATSSFKPLEDVYLTALSHPHLGIEDTFSSYSRLVTQYDNAHYASKLPAANKLYSASLGPTSEREMQEFNLRQAEYSLPAYMAYIDWELEVNEPNVSLVTGLFERAIQAFPNQVDLWESFVEFAESKRKPALTASLQLIERAIKALPGSGPLWALYFRLAERAKQGTLALEALFERAISTKLLNQDVEALVTVYEARAGYQRREIEELTKGEEDLDGDVIDKVVDVLEEGIEAVRSCSKKGLRDPQLRLEKHLLRQLERYGRVDEAAQLWEQLTKDMRSSYAVWYGRADFEMRTGDMESAHRVYQEGCGQRGLDYPEYLLDAWLAFEKHSGNLPDLEYTMKRVKRQRKGLEARRLREAQAAMASTTTQPEPSHTSVPQNDAQVPQGNGTSKKRDRSPTVDDGASSKKFRPQEQQTSSPFEPKRDRENATVFVVASSEAAVTEDDLKQLFKDCGDIRECKVKSINGTVYAMIEFKDKTSVPAAQTKDKKKINGVEVDVHIAWKSCLWVTNFPESYDKEKVEALFAPYGTIFDCRWPSKRFKETRRFCYVQFTTQESALEAAKILHGTILDGLRLSVLISDPAARTRRTDADASQKELYVGSLPKFVKEPDLRKLFEPYGAIKGVRIGTDDKGDCKGYAFVEFEEEEAAKKALAVNNVEFKKRHISVTIAESRQTGIIKDGPKQPRSLMDQKSVRVTGIPSGTEEAVVQQAFEKIANVKRVHMTNGATDAVVELVDAAEAGKVLLARGSLVVGGVAVKVAPESAKTRAAAEHKKQKANTTTTSAPATDAIGAHSESSSSSAAQPEGLFLPRQAGSGGRRRGGLGHRGRGRGGGIAGAGRPGAFVASASSTTESSSSSKTTTAETSETATATTKGPNDGGGGKSQDDFRAFLR